MSRRAVVSAMSLALLSACSRGKIPEPEVALRAYSAAAKEGDADALYEMLTREARRTYGRDGVKRLVAEQRNELTDRAKTLAAPHHVETTATLRYPDGEKAILVVEAGQLRLASAGTLPTGARSPGEALGELREALARRSYPALVRVLTSDTRSTLEQDLSTLVDGLEHPESLDIAVEGDLASVQIPGGHRVKLKREEGVWRIQGIE